MALHIPEMDVSARAGMLLAGFVAGRSNQPNLLTRATRDQALITGLAAATSYGWGASAHSFYRSIADRLPIPAVPAGLLVDGVAVGSGLAAMKALPPTREQSNVEAAAHLVARTTAGAGLAGLVATSLEPLRGWRGGRLTAIASLAGVVVGAWAMTRPGRATFGSDMGDGTFLEDTTRELSTGKAAGLGVVAGAAIVGFAHAESAFSTGAAHAAASVLGGTPQDHRTLGRLVATVGTYALGWYGVAKASAMLATGGQGVEAANEDRPTIPEITGSEASGISWDIQSREGTRWLAGTLTADYIQAVMGETSRQPIRVYASLESAPTEEARAQLLLAELDRTDAFDRGHLALFSPTGSGYVNYVATETYEYLTRGDCASAAIQYSVLPSALSLTRADGGTRQTRLVLEGIAVRLRDMPPDRRPRVYLFGESLGCRVSQDAFNGATDLTLRAIGIDAAVWVGTPAFTKWRRAIWGDRPQGAAPGVGPDALFLPRDVSDWRDLSRTERAKVRYLLLQNGDDPVPKFDATLAWREPDWLGPEGSRPPGAPGGTKWQPITTFVTTFVDLMNALTPTPGRFDVGGHDYRAVIPEAVATVWGLPCDEDQLSRIYQAMEDRELFWEVKRMLADAQAKPEADREEAMRAAKAKVAELTRDRPRQ